MQYTLIKSRRKTFSITINADGSVTVRAPMNASEEKINKFLTDKSEWIKMSKWRIAENNAEISGVLLKSEAMLFGEIKPYYAAFKCDLIKTANEYLPERLKTLAKAFKFKYKGVKIRNFRAKWGSLDKNGVVSLNIKLVMLKKPLIDYVILHELCHLYEFNHGKRFYALLNSLQPNAEALRKELKKYGAIARTDL